MTDAFFVPDGADTYISTEWTRGPWSLVSQHAGPPSALLGRAVQGADEEDGFRVARIAFDILRPVPIAPLLVRTEIVRPGRNVQLVEATLDHGDDTVMRASAWRIRTTQLDLEPTAGAEDEVPVESSPTELFEVDADRHYLAAADSSSGISNELDFVKWIYINPDLAVYLHRDLVGEWVSLDARTRLSDDGVGVTTSELSDVRGPIGHSSQSLLIRPRPSS